MFAPDRRTAPAGDLCSPSTSRCTDVQLRTPLTAARKEKDDKIPAHSHSTDVCSNACADCSCGLYCSPTSQPAAQPRSILDFASQGPFCTQRRPLLHAKRSQAQKRPLVQLHLDLGQVCEALVPTKEAPFKGDQCVSALRCQRFMPASVDEVTWSSAQQRRQRLAWLAGRLCMQDLQGLRHDLRAGRGSRREAARCPPPEPGAGPPLPGAHHALSERAGGALSHPVNLLHHSCLFKLWNTDIKRHYPARDAGVQRDTRVCYGLVQLAGGGGATVQIWLQGWQNERVVQRDGLKGRILLVLPTDPAAHLKKVRWCAGACMQEEIAQSQSERRGNLSAAAVFHLHLGQQHTKSLFGIPTGQGSCCAAGGAAGPGQGVAARRALQGAHFYLPYACMHARSAELLFTNGHCVPWLRRVIALRSGGLLRPCGHHQLLCGCCAGVPVHRSQQAPGGLRHGAGHHAGVQGRAACRARRGLHS